MDLTCTYINEQAKKKSFNNALKMIEVKPLKALDRSITPSCLTETIKGDIELCDRNNNLYESNSQ